MYLQSIIVYHRLEIQNSYCVGIFRSFADASSKAVRELRSDDEFNQETIPVKGNLVSPDYSLSGKIIQNNARAGRIKQSEFAFQLSLTDLKTGLAIWEEEKLIVKQGARAAVGW